MAMKLVKSVQYDSTIDDVVEVLQNVFFDDAKEWESKKQKPLAKQSAKNKRKFAIKVLSKFDEEKDFRRKSSFNKYSSKFFRTNSLTSNQFRAGYWGICELLKNPEYILQNLKIGKGGF